MRRLFAILILLLTLGWSSVGWTQDTLDVPVQNEVQYENTYDDSVTPYPSYDEEILQESYRELKRNEAYQFELADAIPPKPQSAFSKWLGNVMKAIMGVVFPILEMAFWLGVGALVLGALYLIGRAIYETRFAKPMKKENEEEPEIPLYQPAKAQARILLEEIDRLASEGRYGEAVHTLLFRSIQDIDRNRPNIVRRSLTAREIGSLSILTPESRQAFSTIAAVSELSHFGGTPIGEAGFNTARKAYADLTGQSGDAPLRRRKR